MLLLFAFSHPNFTKSNATTTVRILENRPWKAVAAGGGGVAGGGAAAAAGAL